MAPHFRETADGARLLSGIREAWNASRRQVRDARLTIGNMVHGYVLAYLKDVEARPQRERRRDRLCREAAVADVAAALGVTRAQVCMLVKASMAVALLGDPGPLTWSDVTRFAPAVRRGKNAPGSTWRGAGEPPPGKVGVAELERWELVPHLEGAARGLWGRAKAEGWDYARVREECRRALSVGRKNGKHYKSRDLRYGLDVFSLARNSTPKDLADTIKGMVLSSSDPGLVIDILRRELGEGGVPVPPARPEFDWWSEEDEEDEG